jgi:hypothetical protein
LEGQNVQAKGTPNKLCKEGNVAKPASLALSSILIQQEYNFSDEETSAMIRENPYSRYFRGMRDHDSEEPFDHPSILYNKKPSIENITPYCDRIGEDVQSVFRGESS